MARLDDLRALTGQAVTGAITADLALDAQAATAKLEATRAGIPGSQVGSARLNARVTDPLTRPVVDATLDAEGVEAGGVGGSAKLSARGPQDALALRLSAALANLAGADAVAQRIRHPRSPRQDGAARQPERGVEGAGAPPAGAGPGLASATAWRWTGWRIGLQTRGAGTRRAGLPPRSISPPRCGA